MLEQSRNICFMHLICIIEMELGFQRPWGFTVSGRAELNLVRL
jgi:hypothetical protein